MTFKTTKLRDAIAFAMIAGAAGVAGTGTAFAQQEDSEATTLDRVTVTGSLIPRTEIETATPVLVITNEDIRARGHNNLADVLRSSTFGSGGVQGGQTANTFTQGAEAVSFFGLPPGYTVYLINGRPMSNYPALYNGADVFNNISGIPIDVVERVEIIPGGASSLYGSDAIAGVVNFILLSNYEGTAVNARVGSFTDGGGSSNRISLTNGFNAFDNRLNMINSIQYEQRDPIWRNQRAEMRQFNLEGYDPQNIAASRDIVVLPSLGGTNYLWPDGADCSRVTGNFGGTTEYQTRPGFTGAYCGTMYGGGYTTIQNELESTQFFNRTTFELNPGASLYGEVLYSRDTTEYFAGSNVFWYGSNDYYDPDFEQLVYHQRAFAPEEVSAGGFSDIMNKRKQESYTATLGLEGSFGQAWDYNVSFTRNEQKLDEVNFSRYAAPLASYWEENILGPLLGVYADPIYGNFPIYQPDYDAYFSPLTPEIMSQFTGYETDRSKTWDNLFRAIVTNADLFSLPGGSAGLAFGVDAGSHGWDYSPSAAKLNGELWGTSAIQGNGRGSKYAGYSELRLPFLDQLTLTLSGRYDAFDYSEVDSTIDKFTWSAGLEYRPIQSLLLRGKYGTAFRAPTLSDLFQGRSTAYSFVPDYYRCSLEGYTPDNLTGCAYSSEQIITARAGNTGLDSTTADTWNAGFVWAPAPTFSFSADYYSWKIADEPRQISGSDILLQEYYCSIGEPGRAIASCSDVDSWITRGAGNQLQEIFTPRINIAEQRLNLVLLRTDYLLDIGRWGALRFSGSYSNKLKHDLQNFPDLPVVDRLDTPAQMWVDGAKWSGEGSVGWNVNQWTTTLFALARGSTPNWVANATNSWDAVNAFGAEAGRVGTYITYNLGLDYQADENLRISLQVNNLLNKYPFRPSEFPVSSVTPYNTNLYNAFGRSVFLSARLEFGGR